MGNWIARNQENLIRGAAALVVILFLGGFLYFAFWANSDRARTRRTQTVEPPPAKGARPAPAPKAPGPRGAGAEAGGPTTGGEIAFGPLDLKTAGTPWDEGYRPSPMAGVETSAKSPVSAKAPVPSKAVVPAKAPQDQSKQPKTPVPVPGIPPPARPLPPVTVALAGLTSPLQLLHEFPVMPQDATIPIAPRRIFDWSDPKHAALVSWLTAWESGLAAGKSSSKHDLAELATILSTGNSQLATLPLRQLGHAAEFLEPGETPLVFYRQVLRQAPDEVRGLPIDSPQAQAVHRAVLLSFPLLFNGKKDYALCEQAFRLMRPFLPAGSYQRFRCIKYEANCGYMLTWAQHGGNKDAGERALLLLEDLLDDPQFKDVPKEEIAGIHNSMAYLCTVLGRSAEALPHYQRAVGAEAYRAGTALYHSILALLDDGKIQEAEDTYKRYLALPTNQRMEYRDQALADRFGNLNETPPANGP